MNKLLSAAVIGAFALIAASPAFALDAGKDPATETKADTPPLSNEQTGAIPTVKLETGQNSFTENQARAQIESMGFTNVGALALDDQGIWRGTASKGAVSVKVGMDFQGNVAAENAAAQ